MSATLMRLGMHAGVNIGGFACGNPEDGTDVTEIDTQIEMVAMAAAESVAEITADCAIQGNGRITTEGSAIADARAEAYGTAITNVFVENDACPGCTAVVGSHKSGAHSRGHRQRLDPGLSQPPCLPNPVAVILNKRTEAFIHVYENIPRGRA